MRLIELALNGVSVVLVAFLGVGLAQRALTQPDPTSSARRLRVGDPVPIPDVTWAKRRFTLVLVQSVSCRYCAESAPFYRALLASRQPEVWEAVGVFAQEPKTASRYMEASGYSIEDVRQMDLGALGVSATPTLLLVDSQGRLQQQWVGRLGPEDQADLADILRIPNWQGTATSTAAPVGRTESAAASPLVNTTELLRALDHDAVNILDVRDRSEFAKGRLARATNIPADELLVRAPHELDGDGTTLVYCRFSAACDASGLPSLCTQATEALRQAGLRRVRVIRDSLPLLHARGVAVAGDPTTP